MQKRKIRAIGSLLVVSIFLAGCVDVRSQPDNREDIQTAGQVASAGGSTDERQRLLEVYSQVSIYTTFDEMVRTFGEGRKINVKISERYYLWTKGVAGAYVAFFPDGTMQSKTLYFSSYRDLASVTKPYDRAVVDELRRGQTYDQVKQLFGGDGVETALSRFTDAPAEYHRQVLWCYDEECYVQCVFDSQDQLQTFYAIGFEDG